MENSSALAPAQKPRPIRDFTDLDTWRCARQLRVDAYRYSRQFPKEEAFGLTSQVRRAAISVTANIAEGFGRYSYQENMQFLRQSRASAYELRDHFTTAFDERYISKAEFVELNQKAMSVIKLLKWIHSSDKKQEDFIERRYKMNGRGGSELTIFHFHFSIFH